jgi:hypothetical protein
MPKSLRRALPFRTDLYAVPELAEERAVGGCVMGDSKCLSRWGVPRYRARHRLFNEESVGQAQGWNIRPVSLGGNDDRKGLL